MYDEKRQLTDDEPLAIKMDACRKATRYAPELKTQIIDVHFSVDDVSLADEIWEALQSGSSNSTAILNKCGAKGGDLTQEHIDNYKALKSGLAIYGESFTSKIRHPETGEEFEIEEEIEGWVKFFSEFGMDGKANFFHGLHRGYTELRDEFQRIRANHKEWVRGWYEINRIKVYKFLIDNKHIDEAELKAFEASLEKISDRNRAEQEEKNFQKKHWYRYYIKKLPFEGLDTLNMIKNTFESSKYSDFNKTMYDFDTFIPLPTSARNIA